MDHRKCSIYQDVSDGIAPAGIEYYLSLFFPQTATLLDYLPADALLVAQQGIEASAQHHWQDINQRFEQRRGDVQRPVLPPPRIYQDVPSLFAALKQYPRVTLHNDSQPSAAGRDFPVHAGPDLSIDTKHQDPVAGLRHYLAGRRVLLCAESAGRREALTEMLHRHKLHASECESWRDFLQHDTPLGITVAPLESGFSVDGELAFALVAEAQLFGRRVSQNRRRKKATVQADAVVRNLAELRPGAPVVHIDHGVGRYLGLQTLEVNNQPSEYLTLEYAEGSLRAGQCN